MPGNFIVKASQHPFLSGQINAASMEALPIGLVSTEPNWMELNYHWPDLTPVAGAAYCVVFADGSTREGKLDSSGYAKLEGIPTACAQVYFGEDPRDWEPEPVRALDVTNESIAQDARMFLGLVSDDEIADLIKVAAYRITGASE